MGNIRDFFPYRSCKSPAKISIKVVGLSLKMRSQWGKFLCIPPDLRLFNKRVAQKGKFSRFQVPISKGPLFASEREAEILPENPSVFCIGQNQQKKERMNNYDS